MKVTEQELRRELIEDLACTFGSTQIIKFGYGIKFAMHNFPIPEDLYPLPTTKYLGEQYQGTDVPMNVLCLWGTTAMIQLHTRDLDNFGCQFDIWFSEKRLYQTLETFASMIFVTQGVVMNSIDTLRCSQCGKKMNANSICIPCWKIQALRCGLDVNSYENWAARKQLALDSNSIWDDYHL